MQSGVVEFEFSAWSEAYPALAKEMTQGQAQGYFDLACLSLNNTPTSLVRDLHERRVLLWLLVAHQAQLGANGSASGGLVGRVASASRGSVSVSSDTSGLPKDAGWFGQTQYGLTFWQATAQYRQMRLLPGRPHLARIWP